MTKTYKTLTEGPILHHIKAIAIPASVGFLFNTLFNVVDTLYVGRLSTEALAGLSFSFPLFFLMVSFGLGTGQAITALTGHDIGQKEFKHYHTYIKNGLILTGVIGSIFALLGIFAVPSIFTLMGASEETLVLGARYTQTIYMGSLLFAYNFLISGILNAEGNTKPFRNFLMLGFLLNIALNPLFIFGWFGLPRLSTLGVALATLIVQLIGTTYLTRALFKSDYFTWETFKKAPVKWKEIRSVFQQSLPISLSNATIALGVFVINYFAALYGGDNAVAAYGAAIRIEQLLFLPTIGLNIAALSIVSQNFGAKKYDRMKEAIMKSGTIGLMIMGASMVITFIAAPYLMPLFIDEATVIEEGVSYLRIATIGFTSYIFLNISVSTLQAIKKPGFSLFIGIYRQFFPIVVFWLLGGVLGLGVTGVWWGIVGVNWSAAIIIVPYTIHRFKKATSSA
jgi:putative MATE family efflux protein